jgi:hypothetical protein
VHHKKQKLHTLHHVASALSEWEEHKKKVALEASEEAGDPPGEDGE